MLNENWTIKLIDFGEAKVVDNYESVASSRNESLASDGASSFFGRLQTNKPNQKLNVIRKGTFVGTPVYAAPEMLSDSHSGLFTDLWALGCIIYELSCGERMFKAKNNHEVFNKILSNNVDFPEDMDRDVVDLVK